MTIHDLHRIQNRIRSSFAAQRRRREMAGQSKPTIKRAPPGCCQFLIRHEYGQAECGQPAKHEGLGRNALKYCSEHAAWLRPHVRPINPLIP